MCGLTLYWAPDEDPILLRLIVGAMTEALAHRGPDGRGLWSDGRVGIACGHRRLSLRDPRPLADQPLLSPCGRHLLLFNGEIDNHHSLRAELGDWCFRTHSDTETLLAALSCWGSERTLERLYGSFAFVWYDRQQQTLVLARDRLGEKPLYLLLQPRRLAVASQLQAFRALPDWAAQPDREGLIQTLLFGAPTPPRTVVQGCYQLPPGTYLCIGRKDLLRGELPAPRVYWSLATTLNQARSQPPLSSKDWLPVLNQTLETVIAEQLAVDRSCGILLSGGVDSGLIALTAHRLGARLHAVTLSVGHRAYDEAVWAQTLAAHCGFPHRLVQFTAQDLLLLLPEILAADEPITDPAFAPMLALCRAARLEMTQAFGGEGGDELFGGYERHHRGYRLWKYLHGWLGQALSPLLSRPWPLTSAALADRRARLALACTAQDLPGYYRILRCPWPEPMGRDIPVPWDAWRFPGLSEQEHLLAWDLLTYLPQLLTKTDRAAMRVGLEVRLPFLDPRLLTLAWRLPLEAKIAGSQGKRLLRRLLAQSLPPALARRPKRGLDLPLASWLRGPLRPWAEESLAATDLLPPEIPHTLWQEHLQGSHRWTLALWRLLIVQGWLKQQRAIHHHDIAQRQAA